MFKSLSKFLRKIDCLNEEIDFSNEEIIKYIELAKSGPNSHSLNNEVHKQVYKNLVEGKFLIDRNYNTITHFLFNKKDKNFINKNLVSDSGEKTIWAAKKQFSHIIPEGYCLCIGAPVRIKASVMSLLKERGIDMTKYENIYADCFVLVKIK